MPEAMHGKKGVVAAVSPNRRQKEHGSWWGRMWLSGIMVILAVDFIEDKRKGDAAKLLPRRPAVTISTFFSPIFPAVLGLQTMIVWCIITWFRTLQGSSAYPSK